IPTSRIWPPVWGVSADRAARPRSGREGDSHERDLAECYQRQRPFQQVACLRRATVGGLAQLPDNPAEKHRMRCYPGGTPGWAVAPPQAPAEQYEPGDQ